MSIVCPSITAYDSHEYRDQIEKVEYFAQRLHIDFMDGDFANPQSPDVLHAWWPENVEADLHLMYRKPLTELDTALGLGPNLVIVHAEAEGIKDFIKEIKQVGVKAGLALLAKTPAEAVKDYLDDLDYALVFSGELGHFGGTADFKMLDKVKALRKMKKELEIGWDGGINDQTAAKLVEGGVDVLNVGGFIQKSADAYSAYAKLKQIADKRNEKTLDKRA